MTRHPDFSPADLHWLRVSFDLARRSAGAGDQPYGALLVDDTGGVRLDACNNAFTTHDCTGHAELILVRAASQRFAFEFLERCTLYASTEPCAMCAGAIFWSRIGRVVYGLSAATLHAALDSVGEAPSSAVATSSADLPASRCSARHWKTRRCGSTPTVRAVREPGPACACC